jgi:hypothetical protein
MYQISDKLPNVLYIHNLFSDEFIESIINKIHNHLIPDNLSINMFARRYFFNSDEIAKHIHEKLSVISMMPFEFVHVFHDMRIISYDVGGFIAPHFDGYQVEPTTQEISTHTFLLYLQSCKSGEGDTEFLDSISSDTLIASVVPEKGSILVFPHKTAHNGQCVGSGGKILLRGDLKIINKNNHNHD